MDEELKPVKLNLQQLLAKLADYDNELIDFNPEDHKETYDLLRGKIDAIGYVKDEIETRIEHHKKIMAQHSEIKASLERSLERLKSWCLLAMKSTNTKTESGEVRSLTVCKSQKVVMKHPENMIDSATFAKYSEAIKRSFSWDKMVIKANIEAYAEIAHIEPMEYIKFMVKK